MSLIINKNKKGILINPNKENLLIKTTSNSSEKIFIGSGSNDAYFSLDGGDTWNQFDIGSNNFTYTGIYVGISRDENFILFICRKSTSPYYSYISNDGGLTWSQIETNKDPAWWALSGDGKYIIIDGWDATNIPAKFSNNYGQTWSEPTALNWHAGPAISYSGQYMYVGSLNRTGGSTKYTKSSNYGVSWTDKNPAEMIDQFTYCDTDNSGQYVIFYGTSSGLGALISTDYGETVTPLTNTGIYSWGFISEDSNYIIYSDSSDKKIYTSIDKGSTWRSFLTPISTGTNIRIEIDKISNNGYFYEAGSNKVWQINENGTSYTEIASFTGETIRYVRPGKTNLYVITSSKKLYRTNKFSVGSWEHIYTFPGTSSTTYLNVR